jgi:hypothetical protein
MVYGDLILFNSAGGRYIKRGGGSAGGRCRNGRLSWRPLQEAGGRYRRPLREAGGRYRRPLQEQFPGAGCPNIEVMAGLRMNNRGSVAALAPWGLL